jgi:hypothetical protein
MQMTKNKGVHIFVTLSFSVVGVAGLPAVILIGGDSKEKALHSITMV